MKCIKVEAKAKRVSFTEPLSARETDKRNSAELIAKKFIAHLSYSTAMKSLENSQERAEIEHYKNCLDHELISPAKSCRDIHAVRRSTSRRPNVCVTNRGGTLSTCADEIHTVSYNKQLEFQVVNHQQNFQDLETPLKIILNPNSIRRNARHTRASLRRFFARRRNGDKSEDRAEDEKNYWDPFDIISGK